MIFKLEIGLFSSCLIRVWLLLTSLVFPSLATLLADVLLLLVSYYLFKNEI
jgi:hypothetical protein